MTRLRPLVIPAAAIVLATGAPSANAQPRRPVYPPNLWAAIPPRPATPAAVRVGIPTRATPVRAAQPLPLAVRTAPGEAAVPNGRHAAAAASTDAAAAGRPLAPTARGPPLSTG
jgi:hypothetical protein